MGKQIDWRRAAHAGKRTQEAFPEHKDRADRWLEKVEASPKANRKKKKISVHRVATTR